MGRVTPVRGLGLPQIGDEPGDNVSGQIRPGQTPLPEPSFQKPQPDSKEGVVGG